MKHVRIIVFIAVTLLQLCHTEISSTEWYSANVINDGNLSPKPLTEIFTTDTTLSTKSPVVVQQSSTSPPGNKDLEKAVPTLPQLFPSNALTLNETVIPLKSNIVNQVLQAAAQVQPIQPNLQTNTTQSPVQQTQTTQIPVQPQIIQSTPTQLLQTQPNSTFVQTVLPTTQAPVLQSRLQLVDQGNQPQPIQHIVVPVQFQPQSIALQPQPQPTVQLSPLSVYQSQAPTTTTTPNYFFIYQQSPQSIQNIPSNTPQPTSINQPLAPVTRNPPAIPCNQAVTTNRITPLIPQATGYTALRLRVVSPHGTITNVNINPSNPPTTTRRPSTTRTRKNRRRNNYDECINNCKGGRDPICASPIGVSPINPDTLRGFPSICHMSCHNSYRKTPYEKVLDGRCGRFRTRIRPAGTKEKLKRDELNKAQYTVVEAGGPNTVVEFTPFVSLQSTK